MRRETRVLFSQRNLFSYGLSPFPVFSFFFPGVNYWLIRLSTEKGRKKESDKQRGRGGCIQSRTQEYARSKIKIISLYECTREKGWRQRDSIEPTLVNMNTVSVWGRCMECVYGAWGRGWGESKLVFNVTKGEFWLSQSIFIPTPAHHTHQPEARGRTHSERGWGRRGLGRVVSTATESHHG